MSDENESLETMVGRLREYTEKTRASFVSQQWKACEYWAWMTEQYAKGINCHAHCLRTDDDAVKMRSLVKP